MLIHIGAGSLIREKSVIGFFDMDGKWDSEVTRDFLKKCEKRGVTSSAGGELPRSFVLTDTDVIFTHISTSALKNRCDE